MSNVVRLAEPDHTYSTNNKNEGEQGSVPRIRDTTASNRFQFVVPDNILRELVRMATDAKQSLKIPFSVQAACASYALDLRRGTKKSQADYYRLWGWTRKEFLGRWGRIQDEVSRWREDYRVLESRQNEGTNRGQRGDNEGTERGQKQSDSTIESKDRGQRGDNEGTTEGQLTIGGRRIDKKEREEGGRGTGGTTTKKSRPRKKDLAIPTPEEITLPGDVSLTDDLRESLEAWIDHHTTHPDVKAPMSGDWAKKISGQLKTLIGKVTAACENAVITPEHLVVALDEAITEGWQAPYPRSIIDILTTKNRGKSQGGPTTGILTRDDLNRLHKEDRNAYHKHRQIKPTGATDTSAIRYLRKEAPLPTGYEEVNHG